MKMFSDSEESYTESSDTDDHDDIGSAYSRHARGILSNLDESIGKIDDFLTFQRGFAHGDVVYSISDPSKQFGRVVEVCMLVDLETNVGELIEGVNSRRLVKLSPFSLGDYVVHGSWLGRVSRVFDRVSVLLDIGSIFEIIVEDSDDVVPITPSLFADECHLFYYPGQRVSIKHHTASETKKWLCGSWKVGRAEGTVCHVDVGLVHVKWITSLLPPGCTQSPPGHLQDPSMLTLLSCFSHANWQIGDCCLLPYDYDCLYKNSEESILPIVTPHFMKTEHLEEAEYPKALYSIVKIRIKVDVFWQNGQVSVGLDPEILHPVSNIGDHDFWPGQFVMEKVTEGDVHASNGRHLGVVKTVDPQEQIVKVKWLELKQFVQAGWEIQEEVVSAYELIEHPDASYSLGDIVIWFPNFDYFEENTPENHINSELTRRNQSIPNKNAVDASTLRVNGYKEKATVPDHATGYISCIGNVIDFEDESIKVRWASGFISKVHPHEMFGLHRLDELVLSQPVVGQFVENVQNVVDEHVKQACNENKVGNDSTGGFSRRVWNAGISLLLPVADRFLRNISERLLKIGGSSQGNISHSNYLDKTGECSLSPCSSATKAVVQQVNGNVGLELHVSVNFPSINGDKLKLDSLEKLVNCEVEEIGRSTFLVGSERPGLFKQFDSMSDHLDHHFAIGTNNGVFMTSQVRSGWLKRVQQEWSILDQNLPDSIYVRAYEERIDLLRASIIGQPGTPYHHGLFFFDIRLPEEYPQEPPLVHYLSGGLRLNPNLYESGKVCLSLLNTWTGNGTEVWNPKSSTILQVLLSLQALVLNDKPYFNEAGYDQQMGRKEAERNSANYNENAFLLTCKSMLYILRQPPKHFEALVLEHFSRRANEILLACRAYMGGAQVGSFGSAQGSKDGRRSSSAGFRIMLAKLFPMLVSSFAALGIDCSEFVNQADGMAAFSKDSCT